MKLAPYLSGDYWIVEEIVNKKQNDKKKSYYFADLVNTVISVKGGGSRIPTNLGKNNIARVYLTRGKSDIPYPWNVKENLNKPTTGIAVTEYYKGTGKVWKQYYIQTRPLSSAAYEKPAGSDVDCFLKRREEFSPDGKLILEVDFIGVTPPNKNYCTHYIGRITEHQLGKPAYYDYFSKDENNRNVTEEEKNLLLKVFEPGKLKVTSEEALKEEPRKEEPSRKDEEYEDDGGVEPPIVQAPEPKEIESDSKYKKFRNNREAFFIADVNKQTVSNVLSMNDFIDRIKNVDEKKVIFVITLQEYVKSNIDEYSSNVKGFKGLVALVVNREDIYKLVNYDGSSIIDDAIEQELKKIFN